MWRFYFRLQINWYRQRYASSHFRLSLHVCLNLKPRKYLYGCENYCAHTYPFSKSFSLSGRTSVYLKTLVENYLGMHWRKYESVKTCARFAFSVVYHMCVAAEWIFVQFHQQSHIPSAFLGFLLWNFLSSRFTIAVYLGANERKHAMIFIRFFMFPGWNLECMIWYW